MQAHLIRLHPGVENEHKRSFSGVVGLTEESGKTQCYVDVVSSGVLTPIKTRQPLARVRVFGGYKLGNPDLYPGATHDIYPSLYMPILYWSDDQKTKQARPSSEDWIR